MLLIILNFFLSAFFIFFLGIFLCKNSLIYIVIFNIILSLSILTIEFLKLSYFSIIYLDYLNWINYLDLSINFSINLNIFIFFMFSVVCLVSLIVVLYSLEYMNEDPDVIKFISYLFLFSFFMFLLIVSNNFLQFFTGWEGIGLCSYLLISFWGKRVNANKSALKAVYINKIGDIFFLLGTVLLFSKLNSMDFTILQFTVIYYSNTLFLDYICFFFLLASASKSAQLGLHTWLPDAMEGPTPVSALIHAATMVTAGILLIIKFFFFLKYSGKVLFLFSIIGSLTSVISAIIAIFQYDLKKIIAYSTCSQLGYMMFIVCLGFPNEAFFHLVNHAFFKALLFLCAGIIIHGANGQQDIRGLGVLYKIMPLTYSYFIIGSLAITGFPFLSGFFSKDLIIEIVFSFFSIEGFFIWWISTFTALLTCIYSIRLIYLVFFNSLNFKKKSILTIHEGNFSILFPLSILSILSILSGFLFKQFLSSNQFSWSELTTYNLTPIFSSEFIPIFFKNIPIFYSIICIITFFFCINFNYGFLIKLNINYYLFTNFLRRKVAFDNIINNFLIKILILIKEYIYYIIDKGFLQIFISNEIYFSVKNFKLNNWVNYNYLALICLNFILLFYFIVV